MKVLLQRNIEKLGKIGEEVDVAPGYGRNYLLPQGLAVELTNENRNRFESIKRKLIAQEQETKEKFELLAKELEEASCTIIANSSEEGHLYGSVGPRDIANQYANDGLPVEAKNVLLDEPLKELGIYKVRIRLHPEVECEAKVWVVKGDEGHGGSTAAAPPPPSAEPDAGSSEDEG